MRSSRYANEATLLGVDFGFFDDARRIRSRLRAWMCADRSVSARSRRGVCPGAGHRAISLVNWMGEAGSTPRPAADRALGQFDCLKPLPAGDSDRVSASGNTRVRPWDNHREPGCDRCKPHTTILPARGPAAAGSADEGRDAKRIGSPRRAQIQHRPNSLAESPKVGAHGIGNTGSRFTAAKSHPTGRNSLPGRCRSRVMTRNSNCICSVRLNRPST